MDVVLDRLPRGLVRRLEQGPDIDIEADIGESGCDDLRATIVAVLAELDDQHARPAPFLAGKSVDLALDAVEGFIVAILATIDTAHRLRCRVVTGEGDFERVGNLADA